MSKMENLVVFNEKIALMILYTIFRFWSTLSNEEMYYTVTHLEWGNFIGIESSKNPGLRISICLPFSWLWTFSNWMFEHNSRFSLIVLLCWISECGPLKHTHKYSLSNIMTTIPVFYSFISDFLAIFLVSFTLYS